MQWNIPLLCSAVRLVLLCLSPGCSSELDTQSPTRQKTHGTRRFCDPASSNQTAITQGCRFGAAGDRCDRCREGYYGNAALGTCRACPCPSTRNNFARACLDVGAGVVECLCRRGYSGARCERCSFGYYGNPMMHGGSCKRCKCNERVNVCDSLTGECRTSGDSGVHCHECDSCPVALLLDLEKMADVLARLKQQLQNVTSGSVSLSRLNHLEANVSRTKTSEFSLTSSVLQILAGRLSPAVTHLDPEAEQLEADVDVVRYGFNQLTEKTLQTESDLEKFSQNVNGTTLQAEDLLSAAEALLTPIRDLIKRRTEVKPEESAAPSETNEAGMMEDAQHGVQDMRERGCDAQRDGANSEQQDAHKLLHVIRNNTADPVETNRTEMNQTADSLTASDSSLTEAAELLSDAEERVERSRGLNLKGQTALRHLERLQTQLERELSALLHLTDTTQDLLKNITDIFLRLEEMKKGSENDAAQLDGAKTQLFKKLNNILQMKAIVTKAEEREEELNGAAAGFQQMLHNATSIGEGAHSRITNAVEKAATAANQSREAADEALKDVKEGGLVNRAEKFKDNSTHFLTEANETRSGLKVLSRAANASRDGVTKLRGKGETLRTDIWTVADDLEKMGGDDTDVLIASAQTSASASDSTVRRVTERLRDISRHVKRKALTNVSGNVDDALVDAEQTLKNLSTALASLKGKITRVEALSEKAPPSGNMTESIRRIKDVIEETRNFVNRSFQAPAGSRCKHRRDEYRLSEETSWLSYTVPQQDLNYRPHFSLDIKTKSSKGLILHVAGRGVIPLLALYMANGKVKMSLGQNRIIQHKQRSNDGNWHRVELSVEKSTFHLLVDGIRVTDGHLANNDGSSLDLRNPVYLGADPKSKTTKGHNIPVNGVTGCVRSFKMNEVDIEEPDASYKTLPCFDGLTEMGTYFAGGHVVLENYVPVGSRFVLAFELRPRHLTGLLFHVWGHKASLNVFLMETEVGVEVEDGDVTVSVSVTPPRSLCDGTFHLVTVSRRRDVVELVVDSVSKQKAAPVTSTSTTLDTLYIGGTTKRNRVPVPSSPFVGCLRNVKLNGRAVALETASRVVDPVSINRC